MLGRKAVVISGMCCAVLAACGGLTAVNTTATPSPTPHPGATPTPTPGGGGGPTATPGTIDPCSLLTQQEASTLEGGVAVGPGTPGGAGVARLCVYSDESTHTSVTVGVAQTPSAADAEAALADEQHDLTGFVITQLPKFADGGLLARKSEATLDAAGQYARDGATFFFVTGSNPAPSDGALNVAALLVLGSLP